MGLFDFLTGKEKGPGIKGIRFDTMGWKEVQQSKNIQVWQSEEFPAQLSLNFFNTAPDLPRPLSKLDKLRAFYRKKLRKQKGNIMRVEPIELGGFRAVETLFRFPQHKQPGFIYVGAFTLPFADRSYVIKVQEQEYVHIGKREEMIMEKLLSERPNETDDKGQPIGWTYDPYDPDYLGEEKMNMSEELKFDLLFPDHPLSHVRQYMYRLRNSFAFADEMKQLESLED